MGTVVNLGVEAAFWLALVAGALLAYRLRLEGRSPTPRALAWVGVLWIVLITVDGFAGGPFSYLSWEEDMVRLLPLTKELAQVQAQGAEFIPGVAGGIDANAGVLGFFGAPVSLQLLLAGAMPIWAAAAAHKVLAACIAVTGAYLLIRRVVGASRVTAALFAGVHALYPMLAYSFSFGLTFVALPLIAWVLHRTGGRHYWAAVLVTAIIFAADNQPILGLPGLCLAIVGVALVRWPAHLGRYVAAAVVLVSVVVLSWAGTIYDVSSYFPHGYRSEWDAARGDAVEKALRFYANAGAQGPPVIGPVIIGLTAFALVMTRSRSLARAAAIFVLPLLAIPWLYQVPWKAIGLDVLTSYNMNYLAVGLGTLLVMMGASAVTALERSASERARPARAAVAAVFGLALAMLAQHKVLMVVRILDQGSGALLTRIENLADPDWYNRRTAHRVVTVPHRLRPNITAGYGLPTLDGSGLMLPRNLEVFWRDAITTGLPYLSNGNPGIHTKDDSIYKCCDYVEVDELIDLRMAAVAGAGYVVSMVPLRSALLQRIAGPADRDRPPRHGMAFSEKLRDLTGRLVEPGTAYVYRIEGVHPRVFGARRVVTVADGAPPAAVVKVLRREAGPGTLVVEERHRDTLQSANAPLSVKAWSADGGGFRAKIDAPHGGVVVFNGAYVPWFVAHAKGLELPVIEANLVHMAVPVPPGTQDIVLEYRRPDLWSRLRPRSGGD